MVAWRSCSRREVGLHDPRESIDHRAELDESVGARRWALPPLSPVAHRAQPSPRRGSGELAITELCAVMYAAGFSGKRSTAALADWNSAGPHLTWTLSGSPARQRRVVPDPARIARRMGKDL